MTVIRGQLLDETTGNPVAAGTSVEIRLIAGGTLLDTVVTDANGYYEKTFNDGNPGPVYTSATIGGTTRKDSSRPTIPADVVDLSALRHALQAWNNGVIYHYPNNNAGLGLKVTANGTNMVVTVATGAAVGYGITHVQRAAKTFTVDAAGGSTRTDVINLRFTYAGANAGQTYLYYSAGIGPYYEPDAAQTLDSVDIPIAEITVDPGVTSIATNKVTDKRTYASPQIGSGYIAAHMLDPGILLFPSVHMINQKDASFSKRSITVGTIVTCVTASEVLPTGSWSGEVHYNLSVHPGNSTTFTLTSQFGGTTVTDVITTTPFIAPDVVHGVIPVSAASGTNTVSLKITMPSEDGSSGAYVTNARIHGTLVRTA